LSPDIDLGRQGSVDGTLIGELKEPQFLFGRQWPAELNVSVDAIQQSLLCVAVPAIRRILPRVAQPDSDRFEGPTLSASVHTHGHRSAGAKCSKQKVIRPRAGVGPSNLERLVSNKLVSPSDDSLGESRCSSAHNHIGFTALFGLVFHKSRFPFLFVFVSGRTEQLAGQIGIGGLDPLALDEFHEEAQIPVLSMGFTREAS